MPTSLPVLPWSVLMSWIRETSLGRAILELQLI